MGGYQISMVCKLDFDEDFPHVLTVAHPRSWSKET